MEDDDLEHSSSQFCACQQTSSVSDPSTEPLPRTRLPFELYRPIFAFVTDLDDLRNLAVASRFTQPDAERFLHETVYAQGVREVAMRCRFLARNPRVAALVKKILFRDRSGEGRTWGTCFTLTSFYTLVSSAFKNTYNLKCLDASILPSMALPVNVAFRLESFVHNTLVIGSDAMKFFQEQSGIKELTLNPFSYYELHDDDEHYRRLLYTILPSLRSLSCGLSVAIRLVRNRPLTRLVIPGRPDCLDSDQLERVVRALAINNGSGHTTAGTSFPVHSSRSLGNFIPLPPDSPRSSFSGYGGRTIVGVSERRTEAWRSITSGSGCAYESAPTPNSGTLKTLIVERRFSGKEGLSCIVNELKSLEYLSLVVSYTSDWLHSLSALPHLRSLSLTSGEADTFFPVSVSSTSSSPHSNFGPTGSPPPPSTFTSRSLVPSSSTESQSSLSSSSTARPQPAADLEARSQVDTETETKTEIDPTEDEEYRITASALDTLHCICPSLRDVYIRDRYPRGYFASSISNTGLGQGRRSSIFSERDRIGPGGSGITASAMPGMGMPILGYGYGLHQHGIGAPPPRGGGGPWIGGHHQGRPVNGGEFANGSASSGRISGSAFASGVGAGSGSGVGATALSSSTLAEFFEMKEPADHWTYRAGSSLCSSLWTISAQANSAAVNGKMRTMSPAGDDVSIKIGVGMGTGGKWVYLGVTDVGHAPGFESWYDEDSRSEF